MDLAGYYGDTSGHVHGFLQSGGTYFTLDDPSAGTTQPDTEALGINATGQIVGTYYASGFHGFLESGGTYTTLDGPVGTTSIEARGINGSGQIVGNYLDASGHDHGFLYSGGIYATLDDPLGTSTAAFGINASGQIVGTYQNASGFHGFLYSGGTYTTLDDPLATNGTLALGITDSGQIVGFYQTASAGHGFLLTITPNTPPPGGTTADMILRGSNASPAVAGQYEIYDIGNNAILAGYSLGTVGTDWQFAGLGGFNDGDTTDLVLRSASTGAFEVYDIANNHLTGAASLGAVGADWQLGGFAADPPTGSMSSSGSTSQLVQAMAGFGGGSGASDSLNTASLSAETSQQPLLTTPHHA